MSLNNPSKLAELQELEHWKTKFDVAGAATAGFFSRRWVADNIFNLSEEEFIRNQREMFFDRRLDAELEGVGEEVKEAAGGDLGGGTEDLGGGGDDDLDALLEEIQVVEQVISQPLQETLPQVIPPQQNQQTTHFSQPLVSATKDER